MFLVWFKNSKLSKGSLYVENFYIYALLVCLFVCLFVCNKRQNGWTDRAQFFCGISRDPREGLWMIKFSKICLHQNSIFENLKNPRKFFYKIREIFFCSRRTLMLFVIKENPHVFYFEEKMFTNEIKDGHEAPKKPSFCIKLQKLIKVEREIRHF